jgi:hypothetical protein
MVQSQYGRCMAIAALSMAALTFSGQSCLAQETKPELPNPFRLGLEQEKAGNPLAKYAEMLRLEKGYLANVNVVEAFSGLLMGQSQQGARTYTEARATVEANLGMIARSLRTQSIGEHRSGPQSVVAADPLVGMQGVPAIPYLLERAKGQRWVMLGEEHLKPQTRTLMLPLLRGLYRQGFRYFAAETFADIPSAQAAGFPTVGLGSYTLDPVFAEAVREAMRLGYKLVEYDDTPMPREAPPGDPLFFSNFREHAQAERLKERILDKDAQAKVLVWGGRSHVDEEGGKFPDGAELRPMAAEFKKMTGIDPLTSYLPTFVEAAGPEWEAPEYKWATQARRVTVPTVFVDKTGKPFHRGGTDVAVFFPRTTYVDGRPDWLTRELGRRPVAIPASLVRAKGMLLAQAFIEGEPPTAVPADQVALMPGDPLPSLMLPKGRFTVRVIDASGAVVGSTAMTSR